MWSDFVTNSEANEGGVRNEDHRRDSEPVIRGQSAKSFDLNRPIQAVVSWQINGIVMLIGHEPFWSFFLDEAGWDWTWVKTTGARASDCDTQVYRKPVNRLQQHTSYLQVDELIFICEPHLDIGIAQRFTFNHPGFLLSQKNVTVFEVRMLACSNGYTILCNGTFREI